MYTLRCVHEEPYSYAPLATVAEVGTDVSTAQGQMIIVVVGMLGRGVILDTRAIRLQLETSEKKQELN